MKEKLDTILDSLMNGFLADGFTAWHRIPPREAVYADWPEGVEPDLRSAYEERGITKLYTHQSRAYEYASSEQDVVITTPTASGKTLCYNLPVLDAIQKDPSSRAVYLFPTKALGQDQVAELQEIMPLVRTTFRAYTYDGDTPGDVRRAVRNKAHIVVTNPDMLHAGILPHHTKWMGLFRNLKYVVVDELHAYRGVFGSHVANVMRRLNRIAEFYGSRPTFILSSATIANPGELAERITGRSVHRISESGAPEGKKIIAFYNPPVIDKDLGIRRSYLPEVADFASRFINSGIMTIVFARSRINTEVLLTEIRKNVEKTPADKGLVRGYRGGYLPKERRQIERGLRDENILGVVSTNALELGIDIGSLDMSIMAGYPGTITSTWQQAGRAGRRSGLSGAILVASSSPLDQFIIQNPAYFFGSSPEHCFINPDNLLILLSHMKCAAFELPFEEKETLGDTPTSEILEFLQEEQVVRLSGGKWHWTSDNYPADHISLRSVSSDNFIVIDHTDQKSEVIGEVDFASAPMFIHPKAIYLHGAQQYYVDELDFDERRAYVSTVRVDYFTDAISYTKVRILESFEDMKVHTISAHHGEVLVTTQVVGFKKIKFNTLENVGAGEVELPENQMHTTSYWFVIPHEVLEDLPYARDELVDGLLGILHVLSNVAAVHLMCDPRDIGGSLGDKEESLLVEGSMTGGRKIRKDPASESDIFEPVVFLYDNLPGGVGFSDALFQSHEALLGRAADVVAKCACSRGCPSCVGPITFVGKKSKEVAAALFQRILPPGN